MKDYYYILGVTRTASPEEIRKAYRKLSIKFHPDKNDGDKFFEDRFKEINEVYEVLYNPSKRFNYDESFIKDNNSQKNASTRSNTSPRNDPPNSNFWKRSDSGIQTPPPNDPPKIISFTADKEVVEIGDEIYFSWYVLNASSVELKPFGFVANSGQKTIKILGFNTIDGLSVELRAMNAASNEVKSSRILINKRPISEQNTEGQSANLGSNYKNSKKESIKKKRKYNKEGWWFVFIMIIVISVVGLNDLGNRKEPNKSISANTTSANSESLSDPIITTDSTLITDSEIKKGNDAQSTIESISLWKGNHLKNGDSPFYNCFGKSQRRGRSWILFQNRNNVDAVVCLINTISGSTIRNEYIKAGEDFTMSKVPSGNYTLKIAFGNDWNPNLTSPCGSKGFFESNVSYSASDGDNDAINIETFNDGYTIRYSTHTITLYPVVNGNMSQREIDATQFFGQ